MQGENFFSEKIPIWNGSSLPLQTHSLLHAVLCHIKLTFVDDTFGFLCLLASSWIQPMRGTGRSR